MRAQFYKGIFVHSICPRAYDVAPMSMQVDSIGLNLYLINLFIDMLI